MAKRYKYLIWIVGIGMSLFMLAGCNGSKNITCSLQSIVDLSTSDISSIKISEGGGMQTKIEDSKQIEEICSFLSEIVVQQEYTEQKAASEGSGGSGAYFLINYSNNTSSHIQIYADDNQVKISGDTKDGNIQNTWRIYTISEPLQITELSEILSMKPAV